MNESACASLDQRPPNSWNMNSERKKHDNAIRKSQRNDISSKNPLAVPKMFCVIFASTYGLGPTASGSLIIEEYVPGALFEYCSRSMMPCENRK